MDFFIELLISPSGIISFICLIIIICVQLHYFLLTRHYRTLYQNFFEKFKEYYTQTQIVGTEHFVALGNVGREGSDLKELISEINRYVEKTKGTTDFSVIQNKVERKLSMRHEQSLAHIAFPTYLGLMGTFLGVFLGIIFFLHRMHVEGGVTDGSIQSLLSGVIVSMFTSLLGLGLTTINNHKMSKAETQTEEDKNKFYDFVQTELMPSLDVSMVAAISKLHRTVDKFEPAFERIIQRFQNTFDSCTKAFGDRFQQNVKAVSNAVAVMGKNMDKINENINLQERLLATLRSQALVQGMEKYIEAANHFDRITSSLNEFEKSRRMMLDTVEQTINMQKQYMTSLNVPREIATQVNKILDRIVNFENSINRLGDQLNQREILGNDVVNAIQEQLNGISKKDKIADKYLEIADGKLEDLFTQQSQVISSMNKRYQNAISSHMDGFEQLMAQQMEEVNKRHKEFMGLMETHLSIEDIQHEFTHLQKLDTIVKRLETLTSSSLKVHDLQEALKSIKEDLTAIKDSTKKKDNSVNTDPKKRGLFGWG